MLTPFNGTTSWRHEGHNGNHVADATLADGQRVDERISALGGGGDHRLMVISFLTHAALPDNSGSIRAFFVK